MEKATASRKTREFAILTAEIGKATFGLTPAQYKDFKNLSSIKGVYCKMLDFIVALLHISAKISTFEKRSEVS